MSHRTAALLAWSMSAITLALWLLSLRLWALNGYPLLLGSDPGSGAGGPFARLLER